MIFVIPVVGAVSANVAFGGAVVVGVGATAVLEYKYKTVSKTMSYAYDAMTSRNKSSELTEEEIEQIQTDLLNEAFNSLMKFYEKSQVEINSYREIIIRIIEINYEYAVNEVKKASAIIKDSQDIASKDYIHILENKRIKIRDIKSKFLTLLDDVNKFQGSSIDSKLSANQKESMNKTTGDTRNKVIILNKISDIKAEIISIYTDRLVERSERNTGKIIKIAGPKI